MLNKPFIFTLQVEFAPKVACWWLYCSKIYQICVFFTIYQKNCFQNTVQINGIVFTMIFFFENVGKLLYCETGMLKFHQKLLIGGYILVNFTKITDFFKFKKELFSVFGMLYQKMVLSAPWFYLLKYRKSPIFLHCYFNLKPTFAHSWLYCLKMYVSECCTKKWYRMRHCFFSLRMLNFYQKLLIGGCNVSK